MTKFLKTLFVAGALAAAALGSSSASAGGIEITVGSSHYNHWHRPHHYRHGHNLHRPFRSHSWNRHWSSGHRSHFGHGRHHRHNTRSHSYDLYRFSDGSVSYCREVTVNRLGPGKRKHKHRGKRLKRLVCEN